jgi:hypothetical protein
MSRWPAATDAPAAPETPATSAAPEAAVATPVTRGLLAARQTAADEWLGAPHDLRLIDVG